MYVFFRKSCKIRLSGIKNHKEILRIYERGTMQTKRTAPLLLDTLPGETREVLLAYQDFYTSPDAGRIGNHKRIGSRCPGKVFPSRLDHDGSAETEAENKTALQPGRSAVHATGRPAAGIRPKPCQNRTKCRFYSVSENIDVTKCPVLRLKRAAYSLIPAEIKTRYTGAPTGRTDGNRPTGNPCRNTGKIFLTFRSAAADMPPIFESVTCLFLTEGLLFLQDGQKGRSPAHERLAGELIRRAAIVSGLHFFKSRAFFVGTGCGILTPTYKRETGFQNCPVIVF